MAQGTSDSPGTSMSLPTAPTNPFAVSCGLAERRNPLRRIYLRSQHYTRHQRALNPPPSETDTDNTEPILTTSESLAEHAKALTG